MTPAHRQRQSDQQPRRKSVGDSIACAIERALVGFLTGVIYGLFAIRSGDDDIAHEALARGADVVQEAGHDRHDDDDQRHAQRDRRHRDEGDHAGREVTVGQQ